MIEEKVCSLCLQNYPEKKNSHIISKFLSKDLFKSPDGNFAIRINRDGSSSKIQSTVKQDYLFCNECERRLELVETHIAQVFSKLRNYKNFPSYFDLEYLGQQSYIKLKYTPSIYKLFIYTLLFRCSISTMTANEPFKLPCFIEEQFRCFIYENTSLKSNYLKNDDVKNIPDYHFCVIKPERKNLGFSGMYCTFQASESLYVIVVDDFILFFYLDDSIDSVLRKYTNKDSQEVIIALADDERWVELNRSIVQKMRRN